MCRNIKKLRRPGHYHPTDTELHDAALQFVRKISGYNTPSAVNRKAFERAIRQIARAGHALFHSLQVREVHRHTAPGASGKKETMAG